MIELNDDLIREVVRPREDDPNAVFEAACAARYVEEDRSAS